MPKGELDVDSIPDEVIDVMMAECFHDYFNAEVTDEDIAVFNSDLPLTDKDKEILDLMAPADIMSDFIIHKADKRDGSRGKANGCLLVWDDEHLKKLPGTS